MSLSPRSDMNPPNLPPVSEPPTLRRLARSLAILVAVAAAIVVVFVLPAEYGMDPTGIGDAIGLKEMGEIKMDLAAEAAAAAADSAAASAAEPSAPR